MNGIGRMFLICGRLAEALCQLRTKLKSGTEVGARLNSGNLGVRVGRGRGGFATALRNSSLASYCLVGERPGSVTPRFGGRTSRKTLVASHSTFSTPQKI